VTAPAATDPRTRLVAERSITAEPVSVTELLSFDHRCLDAVLAEAKRCLFAGELRTAAARFASFRDGLEHHIAAEEEVLFPALEAAAGAAASGPLHVMRAEHAEILRLLEEVATGLERGTEASPAPPLASLTARLYAHNGKEERILYPMSDRVIAEADGDALAALVARLRAF
jgi:iron-sulfur cluster repair protein YtfE (RIC family)